MNKYRVTTTFTNNIGVDDYYEAVVDGMKVSLIVASDQRYQIYLRDYRLGKTNIEKCSDCDSCSGCEQLALTDS